MVLLLFVSFIFVDIYIAAKTLQRNKTDIDSNDLLMKHLELHQYHCGEIATCGSSEHVEPSEFLIPAPCCIPCSCLPSCVEQLSCCPISVNGTLSEPTTSELDDIVQENEKNETDDGLIFVRKGVESWNKNDENKAGLHKLGELHIATSTGLNNRDSGALKINEINRKNEKCIRPQVFYEPNRYIDAQAYMMVVTCPEVFKDKLIIDKCSAGKDQVALLDMIPVTSQLSGLTYKNKYCLMCNEKLQPDHVIEWRAEIVSKGAMREHIFFANPNAIADMLIGKETAFSNIHFVPVVKDLTKACKTYDIISCNQTGLWDMYNDLKETVCLEGHILPIMSTINGKLLTFKNIGCLHCNMRKDFSKSRLTCRYWRNQLGPEATFSLTLNLRRLVPDGQSKKPMLSAPYIEHDVLLQLQHRRCPAGKVYLLVRT